MASFGWGKGTVVRKYEQTGNHVPVPMFSEWPRCFTATIQEMFVQLPHSSEVKVTEKAIQETVQEFDVNGQEQRVAWYCIQFALPIGVSIK